MKSIVLGKYVPYDSFVHRLDPRGKIFCLVALMVAVFFGYNSWPITFIMGGALFLFIGVLMFVSHVRFKTLFSSLKTMWFIIIFLLIINVLVPPPGATNIAFTIGKLTIFYESIFQSLKIILRLVMMVCLTMILTSTTKPLDLTYALEWYMSPLKIIRFPAHEIAMTISIALRFIPTLLNETERIMKAQSSRGVDFKHGKLSNRFKAIVSLVVPLFISAFQRSEELADAMEARGYDPRAKRTRFHKMRITINDVFSLLLVASLLTITIIVSVYGWTINTPTFLAWFFIAIAILVTVLIFIGIIDSLKKRSFDR